jgi:hypothetical protein
MFKESRANTLSSKFDLRCLGFCLLFLIIADNNLAASAVKEDERFSITGLLSTLQSFFNFFVLYFFLSLQSALSLLSIYLYGVLFLGVNSEKKPN